MSGLEITDANSRRIGINLGSGIGGLNMHQKETVKLAKENGQRRISPFYIPGLIGNMASGFLAIEYGIKGPNFCVQTACATGNHSIGLAAMLIKSGMADVMVSGGAEATITEVGFGGFCNMKALSTKYNDTPEKASRPFDKGRDGFVMAEGSGVLILEELEHAKKRGATIYAELAGFGMNGDAYDIVMPHPDGIGGQKAMELCINNANLNIEDIDYINAHGTSTPLGDKGENNAIKHLFKDHAYKLNVSSTKSMTGHLLGAAGGIEAIASIMAIKNDIIPPTINLENPDEGFDLNYTANTSQEKKIDVALSNSFGFGGHNSSVAFKKFID